MPEKADVEEAEWEPSWTEQELLFLRQLIAERRAGEFLDQEQSRSQIETMLAAKRKKYCL